jgi:hypothetical protein
VTVEELVAWLDANTLAWSVEVNEHKLYYDSAAERLARMRSLDIFEEDDPQEAMVAADRIVEARAYPTTPVGFVQVADVTVEAALRRLVDGLR